MSEEPKGCRLVSMHPMRRHEKALRERHLQLDLDFWQGIAQDQHDAFEKLIGDLEKFGTPVKLVFGDVSVICTKWPLP
jgi:hypothetical protein